MLELARNSEWDIASASSALAELLEVVKTEPDETEARLMVSTIYEICRKAGIKMVIDYEVTNLLAVPEKFLMVKHGPMWREMQKWAFRGGPELPGIKFKLEFHEREET